MIKNKFVKFIKRYLIGLFVVYFLLAIIAYVYLNRIIDININEDIPNFKKENQFGELKSFNDYKGKILLVDFWFQGCAPCLEEMKFFPELLKKYDGELAIMSISIDSKELTRSLLESKRKPWTFLQSDNPNWTFYNDNMRENSFVKDLGISEYPTYLLFDKDGELISTPYSGIAGVENELSGIFGLDLTFETERHIEVKDKLPFLIIPYTLLVLLILFIHFLIYLVRKRLSKNE